MSGWKKKRRRRRDAKEEAGNQETKREEGRGEEKREQSGLLSFVHSFAIPISSRAPGKFLLAGMDVDVEIVRGVRMSPWLAAAWQEFPLDTKPKRINYTSKYLTLPTTSSGVPLAHSVEFEKGLRNQPILLAPAINHQSSSS